MANHLEKCLEGVFFVHAQKFISEEWCPICSKWTRFSNSVKIIMEQIQKRRLNCGHEVTYIFLVEHVNGERVEVIRKRYM